MPALNPGLRGPFAAPFRRAFAPGAQSIMARAIAVLRRFGLDAHIYLPGVGMLNGLTAGNYLHTDGVTPGKVDDPVGLVLDAAGSLGVELVVQPYSGTVSGSWVIGGTVTRNGASIGIANVLTEAHVVTKTYRVSFEVANFSGDSLSAVFGSANVGQISGNGVYTFHKAGGGPVLQFIPWAGTAGQATISNISVREVTGIHSSQPTTANKSVLKLTNGRYNWLFDSTDLLTATYPAGYESVTVIDAISTGQVTTAGANIVGAYSMGPSVTLYGRMIIRVAVSPSDLALLQGFANRLAGV